MAVELSDATRRRIDLLFEPGDRPEAAALLVADCADNLPFSGGATPAGLERVRFAALKVSRGNLADLVEAVALAQTDWRDLLVAAGFADDPRAHEAWLPGRGSD